MHVAGAIESDVAIALDQNPVAWRRDGLGVRFCRSSSSSTSPFSLGITTFRGNSSVVPRRGSVLICACASLVHGGCAVARYPQHLAACCRNDLLADDQQAMLGARDVLFHDDTVATAFAISQA